VKELVKERGILCTGNPKRGKTLPQETVNRVISFFNDPGVSREMPGVKDYVSVNENGKRTHKQKRLILGNLKEIFCNFKEKYPGDTVSFSKFAELRPKECVLAGASGTHTVCVCLVHQNVKLMILGARLSPLNLVDNSEPLLSYKDYLSAMMCFPATEACHLNECKNCPGPSKIRNSIEEHFDGNLIDCITYHQWVQVDRCSLEMFTKSTDNFLETFIEKLQKLQPHDYIAKNQSEFLRNVKHNIQVGQVLVIADFSENYAFVVQDSVQGMHWNNDQATVHPFACYYRPKVQDNVIPLNYVVISDSLKHITSTVHFFQKLLLKFLKMKVPKLKKVIYYSDGAAAHYKNKYNIQNLSLHRKDFTVSAEWHFFATSHGKGPSDGLGGTLKRLAARASLQLPYEKQIRTPIELFNWANDHILGVDFGYAKKEEIGKHSDVLAKRFRRAVSIPGIREFHAAIPESNGVVLMKRLSSSKQGTRIHL
jgi:hypothetical protein